MSKADSQGNSRYTTGKQTCSNAGGLQPLTRSAIFGSHRTQQQDRRNHLGRVNSVSRRSAKLRVILKIPHPQTLDVIQIWPAARRKQCFGISTRHPRTGCANAGWQRLDARHFGQEGLQTLCAQMELLCRLAMLSPLWPNLSSTACCTSGHIFSSW